VAAHVAMCDVCQRVKAEHQRPAGLLHPLKIPEWKWEEIGMDFIVGLPCTSAGYDSIWVIVDRLTKVAHFIPVKTTYSGAKLAELYMARIVCLHGVPKKIVSDRGSQFTSRYWKKLHESLDMRLNFSSAYHPQTDGQTERTNQVLEEMLRACALKHGGSWDKSLSYAEYPVKILDTLTRVTRNKVIKMCKVQWSHHGEDEATWEREEELRIDFPTFSLDLLKSRGRDYF
jgi:hypothetical protein